MKGNSALGVAVSAPCGESPRVIAYLCSRWEWEVRKPGHPLDGHRFASVPDAPAGIRCGSDAKLVEHPDATYTPIYEMERDGQVCRYIGGGNHANV